MVAIMAQETTWTTDTSIDLMTDKETFVIIGMAVVSQQTLRTPGIVIRKINDDLDVYIVWGGYSMEEEGMISVRFGSVEPVRLRFTLSTDDEATFVREPNDFLKSIALLGPDDTITIQAQRATGVTSVARWTVGNLVELIEEHFSAFLL